MLKDLIKLFRSRNILRNWLLAGIKYELLKYGLAKNNIDVVFKCGSKALIASELYSSLVNNLNLINNIECDNSINVYFSDVIKLKINNDGYYEYVMPDGIKLKHIDPFIMTETWIYDIHFLGWNLNNWIIFDIGAYVGDSALYYAKRGATVIAMEPLPGNYEAFINNIQLNSELKDKIIPINAAISNQDNTIDISYSGYLDGGASIYDSKPNKVKVDAMKLSTLIEKILEHNININSFKVKALKMDCKGCEWDVVTNESDILKLFDIVKIEYSGYLRNYTLNDLLTKIESIGFKCRVFAHNDIAVKIGLSKHETITCANNKFSWGV
jgi:FkbM family methyltransferase